MDKDTLISFIKKNSTAKSQVIEMIAAHFQEREFVKNEFFLLEGKVSTDYLFLVEGFMRAFTHNTIGNEVTTGFYSKNRVVFEVSSFFMHTKSDENIQAITDCKGFCLNFEQLNRLFHAIPEFREFGRAILVMEFASFKQRALSLINKSAEERYEELINANSEIFRYAQLKHIASYLGITDSSLSRIRRDFAKKRVKK